MLFSKEYDLSFSKEDITVALTSELDKWWPNAFEGVALKAADRFTLNFLTIKMDFEVGLILEGLIGWYCTKAHSPPVKDEILSWKGSIISWQFSPINLTINHYNLPENIEYNVLFIKEWDAIVRSLKNWLKRKAKELKEQITLLTDK